MFRRCPVLGPKPRNGKRAALASHFVNRRNVVQRGRRRVNITSRRVQISDWNFFFIEMLTAPAAPSVHVCTLNTIFLPALQPRTIQRGCLFIVAGSKLGRHGVEDITNSQLFRMDMYLFETRLASPR